MTVYPSRYPKDLTHTTGIRISPQLREECEKAATDQGITFSQFCRIALRRNVSLNQRIEQEVAQRNFLAATGRG